MKSYRIFVFLLLILILETTATSEAAGAGATGDVESTGVSSESTKPDVIIKLIKRGGAAIKLADSSDDEELPRDKRRSSSSRKNKGRKVGKK